jgi:hypothetical protein
VYQHRLPDHSGIQVTAVSTTGIVLNATFTDASGTYVMLLPADQPYQLIIEARLHRRIEVLVQPGGLPAPVELAGGDLNQDGCVGVTDLNLLTAQFDVANSTTTDINGDGITEAADLAILAGNFASDCETPGETPVLETVIVTATSEIEMTPEMTATITVVPTGALPEVTVSPESTPSGTESPPEPETADS